LRLEDRLTEPWQVSSSLPTLFLLFILAKFKKDVDIKNKQKSTFAPSISQEREE
jgi:hypothetical protein